MIRSVHSCHGRPFLDSNPSMDNLSIRVQPILKQMEEELCVPGIKEVQIDISC